MPADWRLIGLVCGPGELDPNIRSPDDWSAWARPEQQRVEDRDDSPQDALLEFAVRQEGMSR